MKRFADLSEQEVLALAISSEEEDSRIYSDFAEGLRANFPDTAKMFDEMAAEEVRHRGLLFDIYRSKFGEYLPLVRRQDVRGFVRHKPVWLVRPLGLDEVRKYAATMEYESAHFYRKAAETRATPRCGSSWSSSPRPRTSTRRSPKTSTRASSPGTRALARTKPRGACSCCNSCSPGSPA
jgi:hypothetical protein